MSVDLELHSSPVLHRGHWGRSVARIACEWEDRVVWSAGWVEHLSLDLTSCLEHTDTVHDSQVWTRSSLSAHWTDPYVRVYAYGSYRG